MGLQPPHFAVRGLLDELTAGWNVREMLAGKRARLAVGTVPFQQSRRAVSRVAAGRGESGALFFTTRVRDNRARLPGTAHFQSPDDAFSGQR